MRQRFRSILAAYIPVLMILLGPVSAIAQDVFHDNKDKVVRIEVTGKDVNGYYRTLSGSGFFIHREGFLLTTLHVVGTPENWRLENGRIDRQVKLFWTNTAGVPKEESRVVVVYYDPLVDLALLRIPQSDTPFVRIGDSQKVRENDSVVAIGYPQGASQPTPSPGSIQLSFDSVYGGFFRIVVPVHDGSSGGPLLNQDGVVIGIVNAGLKYAQGQGFAIPINLASGLIAKIIRPPRFDQ